MNHVGFERQVVSPAPAAGRFSKSVATVVITVLTGRSTDPLNSPIFGLGRNHPGRTFRPISGLRVPIKEDAQSTAAHDLEATLVDRPSRLAEARRSQAGSPDPANAADSTKDDSPCRTGYVQSAGGPGPKF